jgi:hypothetical protein
MLAAFLLSMRIPAPTIAIAVLVVVLPCALLVLGIGAAVRWISNARSDRGWIYFKRAVLGASVSAWLVLTLIIVQAPTGPRNETVAIAQLRTINSAEVTYLSQHGGYGAISDLIEAGLLDERYRATLSGYVFNINVSSDAYTATAMPVSTQTGKYGYYTTILGVVRFAETATETCRPCFPRGMAGAPTP